MNRIECLATAMVDVAEARGQTHGDARECFQSIAWAWSQATKTEIADWQVPLMMAQLKISRILEGDRMHTDHYTDAAGYISLSVEMKTGGSDG